MPTPQILADVINILLLLAPTAAVVSLILAGINLRREGLGSIGAGGGFGKWMLWGAVFLTLTPLIGWFSSFGINTSLPTGTAASVNSSWMNGIETSLSAFVTDFVVNRIVPTLAAFFVVRAILDASAGESPLLSILSAMFLLSVGTTVTLMKSFNTGTQFATADVLDGLWNHLAGTILPTASALAIVGAIYNFAIKKPFFHLIAVALGMLSVTAIWKLVQAMVA
ncbi:MAG TPA: hypothetical protein VKZ53_22575 [Candidatus Angelobacter sp.]|nr:hypothetical protein [Candidatus Angelobacter sp.]